MTPVVCMRGGNHPLFPNQSLRATFPYAQHVSTLDLNIPQCYFQCRLSEHALLILTHFFSNFSRNWSICDSTEIDVAGTSTQTVCVFCGFSGFHHTVQVWWNTVAVRTRRSMDPFNRFFFSAHTVRGWRRTGHYLVLTLSALMWLLVLWLFVKSEAKANSKQTLLINPLHVEGFFLIPATFPPFTPLRFTRHVAYLLISPTAAASCAHCPWEVTRQNGHFADRRACFTFAH